MAPQNGLVFGPLQLRSPSQWPRAKWSKNTYRNLVVLRIFAQWPYVSCLFKKHLKGSSVHLYLWATSLESMCLGHSWSTSSTVTLGGQSQSVRFPEVPITPDYVNLFTGPATGASCVKCQDGQRFPWSWQRYFRRLCRQATCSWRLLPRCGSSFSPPGFLCLLDANVYQLQFLVSGPQMPGAAWLGDFMSFHCLILSNFGWFVEKDPLVVSFFRMSTTVYHIEKTLLPQQVLFFFGGGYWSAPRTTKLLSWGLQDPVLGWRRLGLNNWKVGSWWIQVGVMSHPFSWISDSDVKFSIFLPISKKHLVFLDISFICIHLHNMICDIYIYCMNINKKKICTNINDAPQR